jgi:hypothetical protein
MTIQCNSVSLLEGLPAVAACNRQVLTINTKEGKYMENITN